MYASTRDHSIFHFPSRPFMMENQWKSNIESAPNCPRCASSNTKFCYYNNYSLSQPRFFCKGCRRYWTKGGSLRNVPVGGGCRKSRRARSTRLLDRTCSSYQMHNSPGDGTSGDESNGTNIDLAAVFAKFLNQDSSQSDNDDGGNSSELPPSSFNSENRVEGFMFESQIPSVLNDKGVPQMCSAVENIEEILDYDCSDLELQAILEDDFLDHEWRLPNIGGESHLQFQDQFGLSSSDDEAKIASNTASVHWNSSDLSVYDIFSRP